MRNILAYILKNFQNNSMSKMNLKKASCLMFLFLFGLNAFAAELLRESFDGGISADSEIKNVEFVDGAVGNGLRVNEFNSRYVVGKKLKEGGKFFVSAWIAPRLYPVNTGAIVNRSDGNSGWLLGVWRDGTLRFMCSVEGAPMTVVATDVKVPLLKWSHVAAAFDGSKVRIFLNGKLVKAAKVGSANSAFSYSAPRVPVEIGRTMFPLPVKTVVQAKAKRHDTLEGIMRFDGIIDEVVVTDGDMSPLEEAKKLSQKFGEDSGLSFARLPAAGDMRGKFGAVYANLKYERAWDSLWKVGGHPDVVVRFPDIPVKYVFWRGMGYVPAWITENDIWLTDQSVENFRNGECYEVMSDKQCRYSHVRIIENSPARCVVHWRYALTNVVNEIRDEDESGWGDWVDEYFTIYPDGVGVRKQVLHSQNYLRYRQWGYQFQETILINQAGSKPTDNLEDFAMSFSDMDGNVEKYSWLKSAPAFDGKKVRPIQIVNTRSKFKLFEIFEPERTTRSFILYDLWSKETPYHCRNHYPISQFKCDGQRYVPGIDRPTHTSLAETVGARQKYEQIGQNDFAVRQMFGMSEGEVSDLVPLARSWNFPPELSLSDSFKKPVYDFYERAYRTVLKPEAKADLLELRFDASEKSPINGVAVVVGGWERDGARAFLDGRELVSGKDFYVGKNATLGASESVFFFRIKSQKPIVIVVK